MKYPVRLFLGNEEVEFSTPPDILFNYSETELTNPTIVKNAYSKTITIEGTKNNNQIFGHIYDMQRIQGFNGSVMGSAFNPLVKTEFTLYYNGSIYESGYFKLDEVRRNDNNIEYDISLFGGLGDYFYNLSFREDGTPMELSDLKYEWEVNNDSELGFQINKEAVAEAWLYMWQPSSKWDTINFAPCYNGIPSNISADKFLINHGTPGFIQFPDKYAVGTSDHEHTEWETFDLRSYLQRPVLRVREVLKACTDPRNNGGYTVNLDSDFFGYDNPYYQDSWVTLPLLPDLEVPEVETSALTITAITQESGALYNLWDGGANATNVSVDIQLKFTPSGSYTGDSVYLSKEYKAKGGATVQTRFAKYFATDSMLMIQMIGYNESGQMSTFSNVQRLLTERKEDTLHQPTVGDSEKIFKRAIPTTETVPGTDTFKGKFTKKNGEYIWTDMDGNPVTFRFSFPSTAEFTKLKLKIVPYYRDFLEPTWWGTVEHQTQTGRTDFWSREYRTSNSWQDKSTVRAMDKVNGSISYVPVGATGTTVSFEGFFSNRTYTKKDLLTLGVSPAQFLLSYAKAFGLYFIKDVERKEISILSRHNFYKRDEIVNINDLIDKGSGIKITPNSPKYQYYDFAFEQVDSEAAESYRKTYGNEYGTATVNTGYQYEKEHKALLDGNVFKGGVSVMEKNKYFLKPVQNVPLLIENGFSYTYTNSTGGTEEEKIVPTPMNGTPINPDGLRFYDYMDKPQFHTAGNDPSDGSMVLLFCNNTASGAESCGYRLTDDLQEMYTLNDGQPCWIITYRTTDASGNTIALVPDRIPHFTRDITNPSSHYIENSFDMGTPLTTYVPNTFVSDWQSIYGKSWKSYISDLYDVNTRILRCRCLLRERPNPDWMRRFYWFDNSYWRLNEIKDWDISSFGTTEMEFIKVQDINNYDNVQYSNCPIVEDRFTQHYIDYTGGTITGIIYVSDGSGLAIAHDGVHVRYSDGTQETWEPQGVVDPIYPSGVVDVRLTVTFPANNSEFSRTVSLPIEDGCDQFHYIVFTQGGREAPASIQPTSISFTNMGGNQTLTITDTSNHGWTISSSSPWITLSATGGTGSGTVIVTATENTSTSTRNAIFNFVSNGTTIPVTITQEAAVQPVTGDYLRMNILNDGAGVILWRTSTSSATGQTIQYSKDNGATWNSLTARYQAPYSYIDVQAGDTVLFKGTNQSYQLNYFDIQSRYDLSGNIMTLVYGDNYSGQTAVGSHAFDGLFASTYVENASGLTIPCGSGYSCKAMFNNCTYLTTPPQLTATALTGYSCYEQMFRDCRSLTAAPELPATTLAAYCYCDMFSGCTSLTTAPALPATTLADGCYLGMFLGCTSLRTSPVLPAKYLQYSNCYNMMFSGCTRLNYITCLATYIINDSTSNWVSRVASSGTFVKDANMTGWTIGVNGIPTNWTVVDSGDTPTFCHLNFTYGDVDAPEAGNWDYVIYYSESGAHPAGEGMAMAEIGGVLLYPGSPWNPSQASSWEIYQPFSGETTDTSGIDLPESFAGKTIYLQAELGNSELGYAVESQTVSVTIPSSGGEVNVTIPQF